MQFLNVLLFVYTVEFQPTIDQDTIPANKVDSIEQIFFNDPITEQTTVSPKENSKLPYEIIVAGFGGFLGWIIIQLTSFLVQRNRLKTYLIICVNNHIKGCNESKEWLIKVKDETIKCNHIVLEAANYTKDDIGDLKGVREQSLKLLFSEELVRITKFIQRVGEIESLIEGFCLSLSEHKQSGKPLSAGDVNFLHKKQKRILSYLNFLPAEITKIGSLPHSYSGVLGAEELVTPNSSMPRSKDATNPDSDEGDTKSESHS